MLAGRQKDVQPPAGVRSGAAVAKVAYERSVQVPGKRLHSPF
jgi:hypothetical protein